MYTGGGMGGGMYERMYGMMTNKEKIKHSKNLKRLKKDLRKQGDQYMKVPDYLKGTLTRKYFEDIKPDELDNIEDFADKKLDPVDIDLTSDHFFDRLNNPRNKKDISKAELIGFFKRLAKKKKDFIEFLLKYKEIVATDDRTNINIPFMRLANKAIAKTIMRKKDFQTSNPQLALERKLTKGELKDKERIFKDLKKNKADFKKRYGKDAEAVMYATATARAKKEGIEERFSKAIIKKYKNKPQSEMPFSVRNYLKAKGIIKSKKEGMYPPYNARQVQYTRYRASDVFTRDPKKAKKLGYLEEIGIDLSNYSGQILPGDVLRAPKGFPLGGKKLEKSIPLKVIKNSREGVNRYKLSLEDKDGKKYTVRNFQMDGEYKGKKLPKWGV